MNSLVVINAFVGLRDRLLEKSGNSQFILRCGPLRFQLLLAFLLSLQVISQCAIADALVPGAELPLSLESTDRDHGRFIQKLKNTDAAIQSAQTKTRIAEQQINKARAAYRNAVRNGVSKAYESALASLQQAELAWSHQRSRVFTFEFTRLVALIEYIGIYMPRHVEKLVAAAKSPSESSPVKADYVARWNDPKALTQWRQTISDRTTELDRSKWTRVVQKLESDRRALENELTSMSDYLVRLMNRYGSISFDQGIANSVIESLSSVGSAACGGPAGIFLETGYQLAEMCAYFNSGKQKGILKTHGMDFPSLSEELVALRNRASQSAMDAELSLARLRLGGELDHPFQIMQALESNASKDSVNIETGRPMWDFTDPFVHKLKSQAIVDASKAYAQASISQLLKPQKHLWKKFWKDVKSKPALAGLGVEVVGLTFQQVVESELEQFRGHHYAKYALTEASWFITRRQLVAHRILTESMKRAALDDLQTTLELITQPPREVLSIKREIELVKTQPIVTRRNSQLIVQVEYNSILPPLPALNVTGQGRVVEDSGSRKLTKVGVRYSTGKGVRKLNMDRASTMIKSYYSLDNVDRTQSSRIMIYPGELQSSGRTERRRSWIFDTDPTTPVTHFDLTSYRWIGMDKLKAGDDSYLLEFALPIDIRLRNGRAPLNIKSH